MEDTAVPKDASNDSQLARLLLLAVEACDAERGYVVQARREGGVPRIRAASMPPLDPPRPPSRSLLERALAITAPAVHLDLASDGLGASSASVRSLALRSVLLAPLQTGTGPSAALVLDSRRLPHRPDAALLSILDGCAALIGLALAAEPACDPARRPVPAAIASGLGPALAGSSPPFLAMLAWTRRVAGCRMPVLIHGESGAGKEALARQVHTWSPRHAAPFVAVNCSAFTESLLDAELFGVVRGAYTGAERDRSGLFRLADGGTLFLDEVADMVPAMQTKLLRALQEGRVRPVGAGEEQPVDVRVVAATHHDLVAEVARGRFRADLFHRLGMLPIRVPPLRERLDDLPVLIAALTPRLLSETGLGPPRLDAAAFKALERHRWPGNVRELFGVLGRALLRTAGGTIESAHLDVGEAAAHATAAAPRARERRMIEDALADAAGSIAGAAALIGWTRQKLYRRMSALDVVPQSKHERRAQGSAGGPTSSHSSTFQ